VDSPTQKNLDPCLLHLKEIEQNKGSNSSSRLHMKKKMIKTKIKIKSKIHPDTQLDQLVNHSHSLDVDDDHVSRIIIHIHR
jgi:hypothetical protein